MTLDEEMTSSKDKAPLASTGIVIPREKAVFWLDANGNWHNSSGRFRHKKISDHFHSAIRKDAEGFFLYQERGDVTEKVYFPYEDTALFVFDVDIGDEIGLTFNTGDRTVLNPQKLFILNDNLYLTHGEDRVRFSERSLLKISPLLDVDHDAYFIRLKDQRYRIASR